MTPLTIIAAIRIGIKDAHRRFTEGGCFQLYKILKELYPLAEAWYDPIMGHVYTRIDDAFYDIDGVHKKGDKWHRLNDEPMLWAKAHGWDFGR